MKILLAAALVGIGAFPALAQEENQSPRIKSFAWDYLEAGVYHGGDRGRFSDKGLVVKGSTGVGNNFFFEGSYSRANVRFHNELTSSTLKVANGNFFSAVLGARHEVVKGVDFYVGAGILQRSMDRIGDPEGDHILVGQLHNVDVESDTGYLLKGGFREARDNFVYDLYVQYDTGLVTDNITAGGSLTVMLSDSFGLTGEARFRDGNFGAGFAARVAF